MWDDHVCVLLVRTWECARDCVLSNTKNNPVRLKCEDREVWTRSRGL